MIKHPVGWQYLLNVRSWLANAMLVKAGLEDESILGCSVSQVEEALSEHRMLLEALDAGNLPFERDGIVYDYDPKEHMFTKVEGRLT